MSSPASGVRAKLPVSHHLGPPAATFTHAYSLLLAPPSLLPSLPRKQRGELAAADIRKAAPAAKVRVAALDLSSLASVKAFAEAYARLGQPLHILICNAGVMVRTG